MNRRFPSAFPTSGVLADGLLLVSGLVLMAVAVLAIAARTGESTADSQETETPAPAPVQVQRDLPLDLEPLAVTSDVSQQRLSDWLDRALRREERATRGKRIC